MRSRATGRRNNSLGAMARWRRSIALLLAASAIGALIAGCSRYTNANSSSGGSGENSADCAELLADARSYLRSGRTGDGRLDWTIDELSYRCDREYNVFIDEISGAAEYRTQLGTTPAPVSGPAGAIPWSEAVDYAGSTKYVCGPLVNSGTSGNDVFLNLGRGYPDVERFTIVIWDIGGVEAIPNGTTLCTTGTITLYQGTAQIELRSASAVEVWE